MLFFNSTAVFVAGARVYQTCNPDTDQKCLFNHIFHAIMFVISCDLTFLCTKAIMQKSIDLSGRLLMCCGL